ncbi:hypothetical protein C5167_034826 [Papaver somniferum]|uniref:Uncharacterized protein n=1 Tax=Papaver somniferum TaxID=3469 RepID=A0A4Y7KFL3_PAPSO|nr:hypothetical protein C5167_034826 [Papaver somniferum]
MADHWYDEHMTICRGFHEEGRFLYSLVDGF